MVWSMGSVWDKEWSKVDTNYAQRSSFTRNAYNVFNTWVSNGNVLEVGAGTGRFCIRMKQSGRNVFAIDNSKESLKLIKNRGIFLAYGDMFNLPFNDESFDFVFNEGVIEHYTNPEDAVKEMLRITKRGGTVAVAVPNIWCIPHTIYKKIVGRNYEYGYEKSFTSGELKQIFIELGMKDIEVSGFDPVHGITRLSGRFPLFLIFHIFRPIVSVLDFCTRGFISRLFGFEIAIKGVKP